jgi:hypothetical protein
VFDLSIQLSTFINNTAAAACFLSICPKAYLTASEQERKSSFKHAAAALFFILCLFKRQQNGISNYK